jgi:hypothetical protein
VTPQPGDFACVSMGGTGGKLIGLAERLTGSAYSEFQHAFVCTQVGTAPDIGLPRRDWIVEAEPGGAREVALGGYGKILWSTGKIPLTPAQRTAVCAAARGYIGTPYSWLDYAAIAAHHLHLPSPGLKAYIASTKHQICSQLVDQCYADAGVHLFADGRWPGYVTPADLAGLLESP